MSPSAARKQRNGIRPSPATGIPWPRSPAGAACAATSTRPPPTASPHSTPSPAPSPVSPGYRHSPPSTDPNYRHPVNGHLGSRAESAPALRYFPFLFPIRYRIVYLILLRLDYPRRAGAAGSGAIAPSDGLQDWYVNKYVKRF